jgi:putative glutamine amidotransferase
MKTGTQPLAAIVSCSRTVEGRPLQAVSDRFLRPVSELAGLTPLIVPSIPGLCDAKAMAKVFDCLVLTGSCSNVAPWRYGDDRPARMPIDPGRDEVALALAAEMISAGKPVFAICRGLQEINTLFGGTIHRDLSHTHGDMHHPKGDGYVDALSSNRHPVRLHEGLFGMERDIDVVSAHHQGIDRLGRGLRVEATAPDGLVEAVSTENVVAVQWHPEWNVEDRDSRAFYAMLGRAAHGGGMSC